MTQSGVAFTNDRDGIDMSLGDSRPNSHVTGDSHVG